MVLPRIITALVAIPFILVVVWMGSVPFLLFCIGICSLSLWEYALIAEEGGYPNHLFLGILGGLLVLLSLYFDGGGWGPLHKTPGPVFTLLIWTVVLFLREFMRSDKSHSLLRIMSSLLGVVLFSLLMGHIILIRDIKMAAGEGFQLIGRGLMFFLLGVIWATDTGAWMVGRWIGRIHLAPQISPKKTWEGSIGGTLLACLIGWFFREAFLKSSLGRMEAVIYALIISITAQISDLSQSLLKRSFGVKDSSQLLPGHGGVMDRFDSFIFSAPLFYYILIGTGRFQ